MKLHIKKGDLVKVITGNSRGKQGKVMKVYPQDYRAIIEGINMVSCHIKPNASNPKGGIIKKESSIHLSNLMFIDPKSGIATKTGRQKDEKTNKLIKYSKKNK